MQRASIPLSSEKQHTPPWHPLLHSTTLLPKTVRPASPSPPSPQTQLTLPPLERGTPHPLKSYSNKVVLVVNTASKCGFTPQFAGLEKLYKDLKAKHGDDFAIIGFPCNQFGSQDPGSNDEIQEFCQLNYGVSFPVLGKVDVCICLFFLFFSPLLQPRRRTHIPLPPPRYISTERMANLVVFFSRVNRSTATAQNPCSIG